MSMIPTCRTSRSRLTFLAVLLTGLALVAWLPTVLMLQSPSSDQVWEEYGIISACRPALYRLGWDGSGTNTTLGAFTGSLPASSIQWLSCQLAHHSPLNGLQSFLVLGLILTFVLALISCLRAGLQPVPSLLTAFLITTAPCSFSRIGHLSLATLWPVIPGLLACHGLWRAMLPITPRSGRLALVGQGGIAAFLCFPTQEYYIFFILLLLVACFGTLLILSTTRTIRLAELGSLASRGSAFLGGVLLLVFLAFLPKLLVTGAAGPPPAWATPRAATEQFLYGLMPFTWFIPSLWVPMVSKALTNSGIAPSTEAFFWSTGSFLIPIAWITGLCQMALPHARRAPREVRFFACLLALVSAVGLLWMTMGGLGTLFAAVVSPVLRSLNRYTVFVYGASLLLLASVLDAQLQRLPTFKSASQDPEHP